jgi:hypothetical protein
MGTDIATQKCGPESRAFYHLDTRYKLRAPEIPCCPSWNGYNPKYKKYMLSRMWRRKLLYNVGRNVN